ncbi:alpha/beta hydrolase [Geodermatophilus amargosae]|uniref:alpha/beta hydrolase n=1 Tax=Geodermatophilus amargosae TaxID=1296565 RepID=UPI0034DEC012
MDVGLDRLVPADLARHVPESRASSAARGERRGRASLEELRDARARRVPPPLSGRGTVEQVVRGSRREVPGEGFSLGGPGGRDRPRRGARRVARDRRGRRRPPARARGPLAGRPPAGRLIADEYFLEAHVGHLTDRTLPDVSPLFGDLRGPPPTLLVVGARDVLLEDDLVMAARLCAAGNLVDLRVHPESPHGSTGHPTGMARAARHDRDSRLVERLSDEIAPLPPSTP